MEDTRTDKRYLIFDRRAHSVVFFVRAENTTEAIWKFIANENDSAVRQDDGVVISGRTRYPHPLAYIEANYKIHGEWHIKELPDWAWQDPFSEVFCGEEWNGGPDAVIADCRVIFAQDFPRSRAKAFRWYVQGGSLVNFYRRRGPWQITILKRYFWRWDGENLTIREWDVDYNELSNSLQVEAIRWPWPVRI